MSVSAGLAAQYFVLYSFSLLTLTNYTLYLLLQAILQVSLNECRATQQ